MNLKSFNHYITGISIPVSAIKTKNSCGIGEFNDLEVLGNWCKSIGIEVIQILPVNDTGFQNSPYSAISAFALHPIYLRIHTIPEYNKHSDFSKELNTIKSKFNDSKKVNFNEVLKEKLILLKKIYKYALQEIQLDKIFHIWIKNNLWIIPYAVFNVLKERNNRKHWKEWVEMKNPDDNSINLVWEKEKEECFFYAWLQYRLEIQLIEVRKNLETNGILLKGDIPILINEDSVDLWINRKFFNTGMNAGAPPDMFSTEGQNWGFPVYNWVELKNSGYSWWKERLKQSNKFYHAYRIDHVLGFFRIWQIPVSDMTGISGYFHPYDYITVDELKEIGFDKGRICWLSKPHIHGSEIRFCNKAKISEVKEKYLFRIGNEDLYNFNDSVIGEKYITEINEEQEIKDFLLSWYRNRTLLEVHKDLYHRLWNFMATKAFKTLNLEEKIALEKLFKIKEEKSEKIWSSEGKNLLIMMQETTDMLMCAEDLGVVPACVPKVLKELEILSLKIERWTREYSKPDAPYIDIKAYPRLSVCTPSVHDTTTLRGWWEEELSDKEKSEYYHLLNLKTPYPKNYTKELAAVIIEHNLESNSIITIFQLQDFLFLNEEIDRDTFKEDRINVPGTVIDSNWSYRMPVLVEDLIKNDNFNQIIKKMVNKRCQRKMYTENI